MSPALRQLLCVALLAGLVATAFLPGVGAPFFFDDLGSIPGNPHLADPWSWQAFGAPDQTTAAGRPLVAWSLALNHAAGGLAVEGYHLVNMLLHLGCALLLWRLLRRLALTCAWLAPGAEWLSLAVAALWAVHPLQTEAVTYVMQRTELMAGLFTLGALMAVARGACRDGRRGLGGWGALAVGCCLAATLSKESAVAVPLLSLCLHRLLRGDGWRDTWRAAPVTHALLFACWIPLALLVAGGPRSQSVGFGHGLGAWEWLLTQSQVLVHYLRLTVWPDPLLVSYHWPIAGGLIEAWPQALALTALLALSLAGLARGHLLSLAGVAFFALLAPSSSFVPIWTEVAAERRMYLPLAAVLSLVVVLLARLVTGGRADADEGAPPLPPLNAPPQTRPSARHSARLSVRLTVLAALPALLAIASIPLTRERAALFVDQRALWAQTVAQQPEHPLAWMQLGLSAKRADDLPAALTALDRAVQLQPDEHRAHINRGNVLLLLRRVDEAVVAYREAALLAPDVPPVQLNLGFGLLAAGNLTGARDAFARCLALAPDDLLARLSLAEVLLDLGRRDAAAVQLELILERAPGQARALVLQRRLAGDELTRSEPASAAAPANAPTKASADAQPGARRG